MATSRIGTLIETAPECGLLNKAVRRLLAIQSDIRNLLPAPFNSSVAVGSLSAGRLLLFTEDNATAGKLRHLLPRLLQALQRHAPDITAIDLRVQVTAHDKPLLRKRKFMPPEGIAAFRQLAGELSPSSLQRVSRRIALSSHEQESFKGEKGERDQSHKDSHLKDPPSKP